MLFLAARAADGLNLFVGLWLVPKYVPPSELGAVLPIAQFASFLAIPIGVFSSTFRQELTNLAVSHQFGKLKSLMRGVFIATAVFFFFSITISHFLLPHFLERIRVAEGSLGMLILVFSFISAIAPIFSNPLQAIKKFKSISLINVLGAPIRLLAMLVTMPFRALSGYFAGQTSVPAFSIIASVIALRKELSVMAEPYWTRPVISRFGKLFLLFSISAIIGGFASFIETTVLRQRIPEIESAAYYMTTRFSDISSFISATLIFTIFPFAAELAAKGQDTRPLLFKASVVTAISGMLLAAFFWMFGRQILDFLPNGAKYSVYYWAIPWVIIITTLNAVMALYCNVEASANRFQYFWWALPITAIYPIVLLAVTGHGYYDRFIPCNIASFIQSININSLSSMLWWMTAYQAIKCILAAIDCLFNGHHKPSSFANPKLNGQA